MTSIFSKSPVATPNYLAHLEKKGAPRSRYFIAMTPRSGSSYLCDVMAKTGRFGAPGEFLNPNFLPNILTSIPADNGDVYLRRVMTQRKSANGLSGIKASWFQFEKFLPEVSDIDYVLKSRFVYLRRRDVVMQAVSLYKATATDVFHTNVTSDKKSLKALERLGYDYSEIERWYRHILRQEEGWEQFFYENGVFPLSVFYEDVESDILQLMRRIAPFVGVDPNNVHMPETSSVFQKVRDHRNLEWALRFRRELAKKTENKISELGGIL